jgi:chemotaxis protein histidine kinase CheA
MDTSLRDAYHDDEGKPIMTTPLPPEELKRRQEREAKRHEAGRKAARDPYAPHRRRDYHVYTGVKSVPITPTHETVKMPAPPRGETIRLAPPPEPEPVTTPEHEPDQVAETVPAPEPVATSPATSPTPKVGRRKKRLDDAYNTSKRHSAAIEQGVDPMAPDTTPPPAGATPAERASHRARKAAETVRARKQIARIEAESEAHLSKLVREVCEKEERLQTIRDADAAAKALDPPGTPTGPELVALAMQNDILRDLHRAAQQIRAPWYCRQWSVAQRNTIAEMLRSMIAAKANPKLRAHITKKGAPK